MVTVFTLGMCAWFADTDLFLTQSLCCPYIGQGRDISEVWGMGVMRISRYMEVMHISRYGVWECCVSVGMGNVAYQ